MVYIMFYELKWRNRPNGTTIMIPMSDVHVSSTVAVGDVVSFSFENYARRDVPVNPKIYRIRSDLSWLDVVHSAVKESKFISGIII